MGLIQRFKEWREYNKRAAQTLEEILLQSNIGTDTITKAQALNIPSVAGCVEYISNTIAMLPINLYKTEDGKVKEVIDKRVTLLNTDTKDTLNGFQFKKQLIEDFLLPGAGYAYIKKDKNEVMSINYVDNTAVSILKNADPIFKSIDILVNGQTYRDFEFIKLTRKSKDGASGTGIIDESNDMLTVAYLTLKYEKVLIKTGGNKKGFLKSQKKLTDEALTALKAAWNNLYKDNTENVVILNDGMEFSEASSTSVEMQMNENKRTNSSEICKLFSMPTAILEGNATEQDNANYIKYCILPIIKAFVTELNRVLLLESEKDSFYFAIDTKELLKGDILKRFQAYDLAIKNKFLGINEVRYEEDKEPIEAFNDIVVLGLQDVLYNVNTGAVYTPNTDKTSDIKKPNNTLKGGE